MAVGNEDYIVTLTFDVRNANDIQKVTGLVAQFNENLNSPALRNAEKNLAKFGTTASTTATKSKNLTQSLSTTRYALQGVATDLGLAGAAMIALSVLPAKTAIDFQREFANVTRTVKGAGSDIETALIQLSGQVPVTFEDLASIATLGGQLGIAKSGIISFTKTVAELTATTDLTSDAAGTFLGRIQSFYNLPSKEFENLASAILKVGVNSVATESQIVTIATRIAGAGKTLNISAQEVIGFSGALASVGVKPYAASGTVTRLAGVIRSAVEQGGSDLQTLAKVAGVSATSFQKSFNSGDFDKTFTKLIEGFGDTKRTGGDAANVLAQLGLTGATDTQTFRQLAAAQGAVTKAFANAASGFQDTTTLTQQYGKIANTAASQITILENNFKAFLNSVGSSTTGPLNLAVAGLNKFLTSITAIAANPITAGIAAVALGLTGLAGVITVIAALAARGVAGYIGLIQALQGLNAEGLETVGLMGTLNAELAATGPAGAKAAAGIRLMGDAVKTATVVGLALVAIQLGAWANDLINNFTGATISADALGKKLANLSPSGQKSTVKNLFPANAFAGTNAEVGELAGSFGGLANVLADFQNSSFGKFLNVSSLGLASLNGSVGNTKTNLASFDDVLSKLAGNGGGAKATQLFNDFAKAQTGDGVTTKQLLALFPEYSAALDKNAKALAAAAKAQEDVNNGTATAKQLTTTITELTGASVKAQSDYAKSYDKSVASLTDFNTIVGQVQTALQAAADAESKKTGQDSTKYYDGQSVSLQQFTDQLTANNGAQQTWLSNLITVQNNANAAVAGSGPAVAAQLISAGYSVTNASFLQQLVDATPAQLTAYINANATAAQLASQAAAQALLTAGNIYVASTGAVIGENTAEQLANLIGEGLTLPEAMKKLGLILLANPLPAIPVNADVSPATSQLNAFLGKWGNIKINVGVGTVGVSSAAFGGLGKATGGYIRGPGSGVSDSIPARLSNGEYVIKAASVRQYGTGMFDALNRGAAKFASGGSVGGRSSGPAQVIAHLSPRDRALVGGGAGGDIVIQIDSKEVARAVNGANQSFSRIGSN